MPRILSVHVGRVADLVTAKGKPGRSGIRKRPVEGPVAVTRAGLDGDESAYRSRDLGDTAVHLFAVESYARFRGMGAADLPVPSFGENLTTEGYTEADARPGDVLRAGSVTLRVTQPVVRCSWPTVVSGEKRLIRWATREGLTGLYLEVMEPGSLAAGDELRLIGRGPDGWTVARLNALIAANEPDRAEADAALALPDLADRWKQSLRKRLPTG